MMHQYVDRQHGAVVTEQLFGDRFVQFLYGRAREQAPALFRALSGRRCSRLLALLNFDLPLAPRLVGNRAWLARQGVDLAECLDPPERLNTPRRLFERRLRYWECRPLPPQADAVVAPADARLLVGTLHPGEGVFIKGRFFDLDELLGRRFRTLWSRFSTADVALFRLTPDKYHYNHLPVSGIVQAVAECPGAYHSCNPHAVIELATPYSRNRRLVTVIQTDVPGGTGVGLVVMVEVVALMIGDLVQCYSSEGYAAPVPLQPGMFVQRGCPKSLFRPGSSTDVLLFERGRVAFAADLIRNQHRRDAASRFATGFGAPLVETEVRVRSLIGRPARAARAAGHP